MATIPASENEYPQLLFAEVAAPATPAAGLVVCYAKSDGLIYCKDDAGTETAYGALPAHLADTSDAHDASAISVLDTAAVFTGTDVEAVLKELYDSIVASGSVATDVIWDAAGDLAVGTGANTAARVAIGATNGMALRRVSGAVAWDLPPGHEFDYVEVTSNTNVTATTEATANTIITGSSVTYDGSTAIIVETYFSAANPDAAAAARLLSFWLYDGSSSIGAIAQLQTPAASTMRVNVLGRRKLTPSAAAHTYSIRGSVDAGTGVARAGAGGTGALMPAYIRITKV